MSSDRRQVEQQRSLRERLGSIRDQTRSHRESLSQERLQRQPPSGGWSVGQVFEHLCVAEDSYLSVMDPLIDAGKPDPRAETLTWRPSIMGGLLARSLASPRKLPAPKIYRPSPLARPGVIDAYLERNRHETELLERAGRLHWQAIRLSSPVNRFIRINLGDCFEIQAVHAERHLRQVGRILQES